MRREMATRFFWTALWLLCTLSSLAHISLGAPAEVKILNPLNELPPEVSPAVLKEIEDAFRKGSTMQNILEMLQSSGDEVDMRELSKAIVSHILSARGQQGSESGQVDNSLQGDLFLAAGDESPGIVDFGDQDFNIFTDTVVTVAPLTTRAERQTTSIGAASTQGGATVAAIPATSVGARESDATAATIRWLDASKKNDYSSSTPMPKKEDTREQVTDSPILPNASLVAAIEGEETKQEAEVAEETSGYQAPPEVIIENGSATSTKEESTTEPGLSDSTQGVNTGDVVIEPVLPSQSNGTEDSEDAETFEHQEQEVIVTVGAAQEPIGNRDVLTEQTDANAEEEIPYGQDEADSFTAVPFAQEAENIDPTTIASVVEVAPTEDAQSTAPVDERTNENSESATTYSPIVNSNGDGPSVQVIKEVNEGNTAEQNKSENDHASTSASPAKETTEAAVFEEPDTNDSDLSSTGPQGSTTPAPSTAPDEDTQSVAADNAPIGTTPAAATSEEPDSASQDINNSTAAQSSNHDSMVMVGDGDVMNITSIAGPGSSVSSKEESDGAVTVTTGHAVFRQPSAGSTGPNVLKNVQGTLEAISHFQAPLRSMIIKQLGSKFARLTTVFRRLDLSDPLPEISTIVSEALSSVRVQHLRSPTKRATSMERDALQLSVNGVRVDVNVSSRPEFVQHGPTIVNHVSVDGRNMYVQLHLHFRNVSVPLNYSVSADLFPPFFSIRRPSGEAHVDMEEVLVPLRIPFRLIFQKNEGEATTAGILVPEDFVTHGASMLNVSTHFADCGERDFMEKEVLRFDEHLKSGLEHWLSHEPLTSLTDTLRGHLLAASRQPATMGLSRGSRDQVTLTTNDMGAAGTNNTGSVATDDQGSLTTDNQGPSTTDDQGTLITNDMGSPPTEDQDTLVVEEEPRRPGVSDGDMEDHPMDESNIYGEQDAVPFGIGD
ncbi:mucin-5AC-like [Amphibalanus amphitrite]|uniref:mucin-5AC-like n=1 Tax=Amphibalanus amphitrite TaxID=1232801 RepID=UPI001C90C6CD|nr:mucin-5AC-like [Amphibalanus amphitrite]XP_043203835.1 mucin-5AC-like [Amphibalanus amphitrite]